ncbi:MAG: serine/threonine protein kinase [Gemmataceae bacterium]|nr:serine/threonine protein kinase [Gemmataceae bacterium]
MTPASSARPLPGPDRPPPAGGDTLALPAGNPLPPAVGKYRVLGRVGSGAFGAVYRCQDPELDRAVAVKVLLDSAHASAEAADRFRREARAAARLSHPHIVPVFDSGHHDGKPYLVMEYVEGQPLDRLVGSPRMTVETVLRVVFHLAQALQAAHDQGVVHRDVKPANVLVDTAGRPKLTDFGLARVADGGALSRTGDLLGTPRYMSPEQALLPAGEVDHRTDIYSLGAVMYELLTGVPPADGPTALAVLRKVTDEEPVPLRDRNPAVPEEVAAICGRMMAKDREARYPTAGAVADAVQAHVMRQMFGNPEVELLAGLPPATVVLPAAPPRSGRFWAGAVAAAGVLVLVGFAVARVAFPPAPVVVTPEPAADPPAAAVDPAKVAAAARAELAKLAAITDDRAYRDRVADLLADLNAAVRQHPDDPALRLARGKLLRRAGEYLAAVADLDKAGPDPAVPVERGLARYAWEVVVLGAYTEPALRPVPSADLRADLDRMAKSDQPAVRFVAQLGRAVVDGKDGELAAAAGNLPAAVPPDLRADLLMVAADALARAGWAAHDAVGGTDDERKDGQRKVRDRLDGGAVQAVRKGLEADPHHPGLLFLKADGWHRRVEWEVADGEDRDATVRRHRSGFDAAYQRFRAAAPRVGAEAAAGRAVLLVNFGRTDLALDQLAEAAARPPVPPAVAALWAWAELTAPPDGALSEAVAGQVLGHLAPAFDPPPDDFGPYLARAVARAATGNWADARRDLLDGRKAYRGGDWPPPGSYANWCRAAAGPVPAFLDATVEVLWGLPVPTELRIRVQEEAVRRLTGPDRDGVPEDEARRLTAAGYFRLAKFWADKDDKGNVLKYARLALALNRPEATVAMFKDDPVVKAWNGEDEFVKLYAEYEKK